MLYRRLHLRMIGERHLGKGELAALSALVPDVGEARLLPEGFAVFGAAQIHPSAENDGVAEVANEGRLDRVGIRI